MRLLIFQRIVAVSLAFIWGGLFYHQVVQGPQYQMEAERNRTRLIPLPAARGSIVDRRGVPLVEDRMSFQLAVFPQELKNHREVWSRLQSIVGESPERLEKAYRRGFQGPFAPVPIVEDLPPKTAFALEENRWDLPGVLVRPVPRRRYLLGSALGSVAGYVGLITEEELTTLKPYGYSFRDLVGKDGIELQYNQVLRGNSGGQQVEVNARGKLVRQLGLQPPQQGRRVQISIDGRLQEFCQHLLGANTGAIVVMDATTGEILALNSSPAVDPNAFLDPDRMTEVREYLHSPGRPLFNRAIRAAVPPGSVFKVVSASEALQEHKIAPETTFQCTGSLFNDKSVFRCWASEGHGPQTVVEALEHSCNIFFYQTGRRLGVEGLIHACALFGLGRQTGIDLPQESNGFVPDPGWLKAVTKENWQEGDTLSFAIGQGALQATPLQMLLCVTAVAMNGQVPKPHLLLGIEGEPPVHPPQGRRIPLDPRTIATVKEGMERVGNSPSGTGRLAHLPGIQAAAKTGTAQVPHGPAHAWFCGYAPTDHPRITFAIFLEHGGKGGLQAALIACNLLVELHELGYL